MGISVMTDSTSPSSYIYETLVVPKTTSSKRTHAVLVQKFKELRLHALKNEPGNFAAHYEDEIKFPDSVWEERLSRPYTSLIICVVIPSSNPISSHDHSAEEVLLANTWVGMIILIGPLAAIDYTLPDNGAPVPLDPTLETLWHMTAMYTAPSFRGLGLGKRVVDTALAYTVSYTRTRTITPSSNSSSNSTSNSSLTSLPTTISTTTTPPSTHPTQTRTRIFVSPYNKPVLKLYAKLGFEMAGMASLAEGLKANGESVHLPPEGSPEAKSERYNTRLGFAMERIMEVR